MSEPSHRRGAAVDARILETTIGELAERGYGFSIDDVARRTGVHKTTIYRKWPTKAALVAAAAERLAAIEVRPTDTGDVRADLVHLALEVARTLRTKVGSGALRAVLAASADDPEIVPVTRRFLTGRYELATDVIQRGIDAGIFRDDLDPVVIWEAIVNPLHVRAVLGAPASDHVARQLVALALDGAAAVNDATARSR